MTATQTQLSPLRRRMIEDTMIRNLLPAAQRSYLHAVAKLSRYFGRSPDQLDLEDVRAYQVHFAERGITWASSNQTVSALRFFYGVTLGFESVPECIPYARQPKTLPVVVGAEEVVRFLEAMPSQKFRIALTAVRIADFGSDRVVIRVRHGRDDKERYVMLSEQLLAILRDYWRVTGPTYWLFPGSNESKPLHPTVIHAAYPSARKAAGL